MKIVTSWMGLQQGLERGRVEGRHHESLKLGVHLLNRKLGELNLRSKVETLSLERLEDLALALLNFQTCEDLENWLN